MTKIRMVPVILFATTLSCSFASHAQPATPQQALQQYVSDLQQTPNDYALREKIIKHVQTMNRAPAIPEEARRHFIEGNALLKAAKDQKGYALAIGSYRQCLLLAPWWGEANYNQAVALELANQFDEAMNVLKLYITTGPGEEESRKAQDKIYEIGAKKIIAMRELEESSPQAVAAREQNKFEDWLKKLDGRRYRHRDAVGNEDILDVRGKVLVWIVPGTRSPEWGRFEIRGREFMHPSPLRPDEEFTFIISEDGDRITRRVFRHSDGAKAEDIYLWQR